MATVTQVLTAATDSVTVITDINSKGSSSDHVPDGATQAEINAMVQRNVDHIETILAYDGSSEGQPNVKGDSSDKSSYTGAVTTGKAYIAAN